MDLSLRSRFQREAIRHLYRAEVDITIMRTLPTIIANSQETYWFVAALAAYYDWPRASSSRSFPTNGAVGSLWKD
jgi:hypothetical protein